MVILDPHFRRAQHPPSQQQQQHAVHHPHHHEHHLRTSTSQGASYKVMTHPSENGSRNKSVVMIDLTAFDDADVDRRAPIDLTSSSTAAVRDAPPASEAAVADTSHQQHHGESPSLSSRSRSAFEGRPRLTGGILKTGEMVERGHRFHGHFNNIHRSSHPEIIDVSTRSHSTPRPVMSLHRLEESGGGPYPTIVRVASASSIHFPPRSPHSMYPTAVTPQDERIMLENANSSLVPVSKSRQSSSFDEEVVHLGTLAPSARQRRRDLEERYASFSSSSRSGEGESDNAATGNRNKRRQKDSTVASSTAAVDGDDLFDERMQRTNLPPTPNNLSTKAVNGGAASSPSVRYLSSEEELRGLEPPAEVKVSQSGTLPSWEGGELSPSRKRQSRGRQSPRVPPNFPFQRIPPLSKSSSSPVLLKTVNSKAAASKDSEKANELTREDVATASTPGAIGAVNTSADDLTPDIPFVVTVTSKLSSADTKEKAQSPVKSFIRDSEEQSVANKKQNEDAAPTVSTGSPRRAEPPAWHASKVPEGAGDRRKTFRHSPKPSNEPSQSEVSIARLSEILELENQRMSPFEPPKTILTGGVQDSKSSVTDGPQKELNTKQTEPTPSPTTSETLKPEVLKNAVTSSSAVVPNNSLQGEGRRSPEIIHLEDNYESADIFTASEREASKCPKVTSKTDAMVILDDIANVHTKHNKKPDNDDLSQSNVIVVDDLAADQSKEDSDEDDDKVPAIKIVASGQMLYRKAIRKYKERSLTSPTLQTSPAKTSATFEFSEPKDNSSNGKDLAVATCGVRDCELNLDSPGGDSAIFSAEESIASSLSFDPNYVRGGTALKGFMASKMQAFSCLKQAKVDSVSTTNVSSAPPPIFEEEQDTNKDESSIVQREKDQTCKIETKDDQVNENGIAHPDAVSTSEPSARDLIMDGDFDVKNSDTHISSGVKEDDFDQPRPDFVQEEKLKDRQMDFMKAADIVRDELVWTGSPPLPVWRTELDDRRESDSKLVASRSSSGVIAISKRDGEEARSFIGSTPKPGGDTPNSEPHERLASISSVQPYANGDLAETSETMLHEERVSSQTIAFNRYQQMRSAVQERIDALRSQALLDTVNSNNVEEEDSRLLKNSADRFLHTHDDNFASSDNSGFRDLGSKSVPQMASPEHPPPECLSMEDPELEALLASLSNSKLFSAQQQEGYIQAPIAPFNMTAKRNSESLCRSPSSEAIRPISGQVNDHQRKYNDEFLSVVSGPVSTSDVMGKKIIQLLDDNEGDVLINPQNKVEYSKDLAMSSYESNSIVTGDNGLYLSSSESEDEYNETTYVPPPPTDRYFDEASDGKTYSNTSLESEIETDYDALYQGCSLPFVAKLFDKGCAWIESETPQGNSSGPSFLYQLRKSQQKKTGEDKTSLPRERRYNFPVATANVPSNDKVVGVSRTSMRRVPSHQPEPLVTEDPFRGRKGWSRKSAPKSEHILEPLPEVYFGQTESQQQLDSEEKVLTPRMRNTDPVSAVRPSRSLASPNLSVKSLNDASEMWSASTSSQSFLGEGMETDSDTEMEPSTSGTMDHDDGPSDEGATAEILDNLETEKQDSTLSGGYDKETLGSTVNPSKDEPLANVEASRGVESFPSEMGNFKDLQPDTPSQRDLVRETGSPHEDIESTSTPFQKKLQERLENLKLSPRQSPTDQDPVPANEDEARDVQLQLGGPNDESPPPAKYENGQLHLPNKQNSVVASSARDMPEKEHRMDEAASSPFRPSKIATSPNSLDSRRLPDPPNTLLASDTIPTPIQRNTEDPPADRVSSGKRRSRATSNSSPSKTKSAADRHVSYASQRQVHVYSTSGTETDAYRRAVSAPRNVILSNEGEKLSSSAELEAYQPKRVSSPKKNRKKKSSKKDKSEKRSRRSPTKSRAVASPSPPDPNGSLLRSAEMASQQLQPALGRQGSISPKRKSKKKQKQKLSSDRDSPTKRRSSKHSKEQQPNSLELAGGRGSGGPEALAPSKAEKRKKKQKSPSRRKTTTQDHAALTNADSLEEEYKKTMEGLSEDERLAALELVEKLRRRAATLKRRRKVKDRRGKEQTATEVENNSKAKNVVEFLDL